jgi:hypothetical protein
MRTIDAEAERVGSVTAAEAAIMSMRIAAKPDNDAAVARTTSESADTFEVEEKPTSTKNGVQKPAFNEELSSRTNNPALMSRHAGKTSSKKQQKAAAARAAARAAPAKRTVSRDSKMAALKAADGNIQKQKPTGAKKSQGKPKPKRELRGNFAAEKRGAGAVPKGNFGVERAKPKNFGRMV